MSLKRKKITTKEYIRGIAHGFSQVHAGKKHIEKMDARYINDRCTIKIGQTIPLGYKQPDGFTSMVVEQIKVERKEAGSNKENLVEVSFAIYGLFSGPGVESKRGRLQIGPKHEAEGETDQEV